jgi:hypothetical protein
VVEIVGVVLLWLVVDVGRVDSVPDVGGVVAAVGTAGVVAAGVTGAGVV